MCESIFDKAIEGCSTSQISYYMNEQKIPTPGRYNKENGLTHYGYNQKMPESEILWDCGMVRMPFLEDMNIQELWCRGNDRVLRLAVK